MALLQPSWLGVMERAQRRRPGIVTGRTMSSEAGTPVGLYHNVCGTLNGRSLADGSMLYGCTCNLSVDLGRVDLDFDMTFTEVGTALAETTTTQTSLAVRHSYVRFHGSSSSSTPCRLALIQVELRA